MIQEPNTSEPRILRSKIGSHLSDPVKYSELCEILDPAMGQLQVGVRFSAYEAPRKNEVRESYKVIEVNHDPQDFLSLGIWSIYVFAVPRAARAEVRAVLLPALSDRIRPWMLELRSEGWLSRYHSLRGSFAAPSGSLRFVEHNAF